jgi:purine nucleoside permease
MNCCADAASPLLVPRIVIVAPMLSELERWTERLPLGSALAFPAGAHPERPPLRWNSTLGVLGMVAGMGPTRSSTSVAALGHDARFDLGCAHWLLAGIAGVDPSVGSIGSAFWARSLISLDGGSYVDGVGHVPSGRSPNGRYTPPFPTRAEAEKSGHLYTLNTELVAMAFAASKGVQLLDTPHLRRAREGYAEPAASAPPRVLLGDATTAAYFWAGRVSNAWAANESRFYTGGGNVAATTDEEDTAVAEALGSLHRAGRANSSRLLVLRAASDYTYPPSGIAIEDWFFVSKLHFAEEEALDALWAAGRPAVEAITRGCGRASGAIS